MEPATGSGWCGGNAGEPSFVWNQLEIVYAGALIFPSSKETRSFGIGNPFPITVFRPLFLPCRKFRALSYTSASDSWSVTKYPFMVGPANRFLM